MNVFRHEIVFLCNIRVVVPPSFEERVKLRKQNCNLIKPKKYMEKKTICNAEQKKEQITSVAKQQKKFILVQRKYFTKKCKKL